MNKVIYNHPAIPKEDIIVGQEYVLEDLLKKFKIGEIKAFFKEVNFKFEDLESTKEIKK
jgi:hypothetical protein